MAIQVFQKQRKRDSNYVWGGLKGFPRGGDAQNEICRVKEESHSRVSQNEITE